MRRTLLPLLVLITASVLTALPVVAASDDDGWQIGVMVWNGDTVTSPDALYCLMPETMPIRPGNLVRLQDASGRELEVSAFEDRVERSVGKGLFQPGEPCQLLAFFASIKPQEGLRLVITPDPAPPTSASTERVFISPYVQTFGPYDWWYNAEGFKDCRFLGDVPIGDGSPVVIDPPARLPFGADKRTHQLVSNITSTPFNEAERCGLGTMLEFPIADEYVIEFGGESQAEDTD